VEEANGPGQQSEEGGKNGGGDIPMLPPFLPHQVSHDFWGRKIAVRRAPITDATPLLYWRGNGEKLAFDLRRKLVYTSSGNRKVSVADGRVWPTISDKALSTLETYSRRFRGQIEAEIGDYSLQCG